MLDWEVVAYELLSARSNDVVKLARALADGEPLDVDELDLRAMTGLEIKAGGVRVELVDRAAVLAAAEKAGLIGDADASAAASFFEALEGAARKDD